MQFTNSGNFELKEVESSSKKIFNRKRFFKLVCGESKFFHLSYGSFPSDILQRSKKIYQALPQIIVKPQFYSAKGKLGLFAQDWFEGKTIETLSASPKNKMILNKG